MNTFPQPPRLGRLRLLETFYYFDGPRLFSCESTTGQVYLVFWLGDEDDTDRWLYVPMSKTRLNQVRSGVITLRRACTDPEDGWVWLVSFPLGDEASAVVDQIDPSLLADDDLPRPSAILELPTTTLANHLEETSIHAERAGTDVLDFALDYAGRTRNEIPIQTLGTSLVATQNVLTCLIAAAEGYTSRQGRLPEQFRKQAELVAIDAFAASFGLRLEATNNLDLFSESKVSTALETFMTLLENAQNIDTLKQLLKEYGARVALSFALLLDSFARSQTTCKTVWASARKPNVVRTAKLEWETAEFAAKALAETVSELEEHFTIRARLEGLNVRTKVFDLVDLETNERYRGRIADDFVEAAEDAAAKIPSTCFAELVRKDELNSSTGEARAKYTLVKVNDFSGDKTAAPIKE